MEGTHCEAVGREPFMPQVPYEQGEPRKRGAAAPD